MPVYDINKQRRSITVEIDYTTGIALAEAISFILKQGVRYKIQPGQEYLKLEMVKDEVAETLFIPGNEKRNLKTLAVRLMDNNRSYFEKVEEEAANKIESIRRELPERRQEVENER